MKYNVKSAVLVSVTILVFLLSFGLFSLVPSHSPIQQHRPSVILEDMVPFPPEVEQMWKTEIGRRFDNAVGILVHGGDFVPGHWIVGSSLQPWKHVMPVQELVHDMQALYPDRTIVLVSCNPGHLHLGIPGVYYAHSNVWIVPDRNVFDQGVLDNPIIRWCTLDGQFPYTWGGRWETAPDVVGNIFEFQKD